MRYAQHSWNRLSMTLILVFICGYLVSFAADELQLVDLQYTEHGDRVRLVVTANIPFMYDVRSAGQGTIIVETDHADISKLARSYNIGSAVVDQINISNHTGNGIVKTEMIIKYNDTYRFSHKMQGRKLVLEFRSVGNTQIEKKPLVESNKTENVTTKKETTSAQLPKVDNRTAKADSKTNEPVVKKQPVNNTKTSAIKQPVVKPVRNKPATSNGTPVSANFCLKAITERTGNGWAEVVLLFDKQITRDDFKILPVGAPKRFVIDFHNARNSASSITPAGGSDYYQRVRTALNRIDPYPVTRVVVDQGSAKFKNDPDYRIEGENLILRFSGAPVENLSVKKVAPEKQKQEVPVTTVRKKETEPQIKTKEPEVKPVAIAKEKPVEQKPKVANRKKVISETVDTMKSRQGEKKVEIPVKTEDRKEEPVTNLVKDEKPVSSEITTKEIPVQTTPDSMEADESVFDKAFPQDRSQESTVRDQQVDSSSGADQYSDQDRNVSSQEVIAGDPDFFQTREIVGEQKEYTGAVVDLEFDNIALNQVILLLGQLTDKNFIVDPSVSNISISISMKNEPWDKALDYILDYHGLGMIEDGNLIRIATRDKLATEAAEKRRLQEERALAVPLRQVAKPINYATASELVKLLNSNLSAKGSVNVDERTNTLIITDIPSKVDEHINLIETLDIPTKQVYVEARIVETTRDFINEIGLQFGFRGSYTQQYGNSTGLVFPNQFTISGNPTNGVAPTSGSTSGGSPFAVNLPSPEATTSILGSFSNISGSFVLDAVLSAAESERKVRVLSRPRISAQNNKQAIIKSGVEVPYQVIQNNTVSIRYREATLKLEVTPHITADSTVIMDVLVDKSSLGVRTDAGFSIQTRQATSTIRVKDGGVAVIGGVLEINDSYTEERTPFLHRIPLIGNLFKNQLSRIQNTELIIFISPKIIG